uniref:Uncharacterized protein n=1 Tax=Anguilla anguilla TaxID=7936 RepID=A0A0E9W5W9_ANGAN
MVCSTSVIVVYIRILQLAYFLWGPGSEKKRKSGKHFAQTEEKQYVASIYTFKQLYEYV